MVLPAWLCAWQTYMFWPVREPIQPAPQPRTPAPNSAPKSPGMASWKRPLNIRIPAKIKPPKQMTAPAYIAKVLKVVISVVAPVKSIVPWACATPTKVSATSVGPATRIARARDCFEKGEALRLARRLGRLAALLWLIIGYLQQR